MRFYAPSRYGSMLRGAARAVDFFGVLSRTGLPAATAAQAIYSDWQAVGEDLFVAMDAHKAEQAAVQKKLFE